MAERSRKQTDRSYDPGSAMRDLSDGRAVHLMIFRYCSMTDVEGGRADGRRGGNECQNWGVSLPVIISISVALKAFSETETSKTYFICCSLAQLTQETSLYLRQSGDSQRIEAFALVSLK